MVSAFVLIQVVMVAVVIAFPSLVLSAIHQGPSGNPDVQIDIPAPDVPPPEP